ncbi:MAG: RES family NAD+ phosphorylase [Lacisediminihabitans sp.]
MSHGDNADNADNADNGVLQGETAADSRQTVVQKGPTADTDLSNFPVISVSGVLYRAHSTAHGPWYFDSGDGGRFNLEAPEGTCYAASDIWSATRERLADFFAIAGQSLAEAKADKFHVTELTLETAIKCANLDSAFVVESNITRELSSMEDYSVSRSWATAFRNEQFEGMFYPSRFTAGPATAVAMFGAAGEHSLGLIGAVTSGRDACAQAHIAVVSIVGSNNVRFEETPRP